MRKSKCLFIILFAFIALIGCGKRPVFQPGENYQEDNDRKVIDEPASRSPLLVWQLVERTTFRQAEQLLDIDRGLRKVSGNSRQSYNINSYDEIPNSAWFTNRIGQKTLSNEELGTGYVVTGGPDTSGPWTVFRPKVGGVTAGFWIKDVQGNAYILKFDPPNNPEMATAAAAMTGRFFYACGYNVPEETITSFHPDSLVIKDGVTYKDSKGEKHPFTRDKLNEILKKAYHNSDGTIRCLASLALPNIKGPFSFSGVRKDDPNDWCPHEYRRELRALYVFCSFVNHWDIKDENTMDIFVGDSGRGYIEHYLLDFGSTMGSAGHGPQNPRSGYANSFDLRDAIVSFFTLGLKKWQWEDAKPYQYPSIGYFESDIFHPAKWDPIYPIPAFENMTNRDAYWAAKIIMRFGDEDLSALIEAGQLSNPEARQYLFNTLKMRRDKIGYHWFSKVNPLDDFSLEQREKTLDLSFIDLAAEYGFDDLAAQEFEFDVSYDGKTIKVGKTSAPFISLDSQTVKALRDASAGSDFDNPERRLYRISIVSRLSNGKNTRPVHIWLWYEPTDVTFQLVGIVHED
ncbi:MAG: hypothetical protein R3F48_13220 [Candidatus Zixiibacteriota bacterium]